MNAKLFPDWQQQVTFSPQGPASQPLWIEGPFKVVLAGLEPGQMIPPHPEGSSVYHFLEGQGVMQVDGEPVEVSAGQILVMPDGAERGLRATTRLVFLAARSALGVGG